MRRWGLAGFVVLVMGGAAFAQATDGVTASVAPAEGTSPKQAVGYGALPGGINVPDAETLPKGALQLITIDGYGYRKGALNPGSTLTRALGSIAVAFGVHELFSVGLSLDGRYDKTKHTNAAVDPDDGYVGDPHIIGRFAKATGTARFGAQLGIWVPGKDAPSIAGSAISFDVRVLASLPAGPGILSFEVGYRLDNSSSSVDKPELLSLADRIQLGVSDFNAVFGGVHLAFPVGQAWIGAEASLDAFLGDPPSDGAGGVKVGHAALTDGKLTFRGGISGGYHINDQFAVLAYVEGAKVPYITAAQVMDNNIPLIPYEPTFTLGVGLSAQFGKSKSQAQFKGCAYTAEGCPAVETPIVSDITGTVVDDTDKPLVGAKVSIKLANVTVDPVATDQTGKYTFKAVRIGTQAEPTKSKPALHRIDESSATISVALDGKKPGTATISKLDDNTTNVPPIKLDPVTPPGLLRGEVHSLPKGNPVARAVVTVAPGGAKTETAADGTFSINLPPGTYKMTVKAPGLASQELEVVIEVGSVVIKNIDLHR
ncbi:MAG TPA: carboxypeptidase regulatory-like domain-containing protein [Kofleriaceae bacterium]